MLIIGMVEKTLTCFTLHATQCQLDRTFGLILVFLYQFEIGYESFGAILEGMKQITVLLHACIRQLQLASF